MENVKHIVHKDGFVHNRDCQNGHPVVVKVM